MHIAMTFIQEIRFRLSRLFERIHLPMVFFASRQELGEYQVISDPRWSHLNTEVQQSLIPR